MLRFYKAFVQGFRYAIAGLIYTLRTQRNMRVHVLMACLACMISGWLKLQPTEWAILFLTLALVMALEMVNTALETTLNLISEDFHPQIKIGKDVAAGAVFIVAIFALGVGAALWLPKLKPYFMA